MDNIKTVWIDAFKVGDLIAHPRYGDKRYAEKQLLESIRNFRELSAKGYETTLLREHGSEDSYVYGKVHDLRITPAGYFQASVQFYRQADRDAYNSGILREFSPGFAASWLDPHTGKTLENVLIELSFTSRAYQRNLRPPQDINPGILLSDAPTYLADTPDGKHAITPAEAPMKPEEEEEIALADAEAEEVEEVELAEEPFDARAASEANGAKLDAIIAFLMPADAEGEVEMSADATELELLSAECASLKNQVVRMELSAKGFSDEKVDTLVTLSAKLNAEEFDAMVALTQGGSVQAEIGVQGTAPVGIETLSANGILDEAKKAGVEYGSRNNGGLVSWATKNYPDRVSEIINHARH